MGTETRMLDELEALAERMGNSQRFGQPLSVEMPKGWAKELSELTASLRAAVQGEPARAGANRLVRDFSVRTEYWEEGC